MVITPHALIGALAGRGRNTVSGSLAAGIASHYLADRVPHSDYPLGGLRGCGIAAADVTLAAGLLLASGGVSKRVLAGAVGGLLPDVLSVLSPGRRDPLTRLHDRSHTSVTTSHPLSIALQSLAAASALLLLTRKR